MLESNMAVELVKKRDVAVDFVKVIATLLVLNSHMGICYGRYSAFATGGGIGDALFFFISGFTLFMGRKGDFINWYKRRIGRIYPTVLAVGLAACVLFHKDQSLLEVLFVQKYWFLQCILVCYLLLYPVIRYDWSLKICIPISIVAMIVSYYAFFDFDGQMFYGVNNLFRWIVYFSVMLIGGGIYLNANALQCRWWTIPLLLLCILIWYGINYITKGGDLAILSYIPLIGICVLVYITGKSSFIERLFGNKIWGNILFIIGNLCLESYMIQKYIFTDAINNIFPMNIPIIMLAVLISAYFIHILASVISQIFDSKPFDWKGLLLYMKK